MTELQLRKIAKVTIAIIGVLTLLSIFPLSNLRFNYEFERFFPQGDPELEFYESFREQFYPDNDFVLVGIVNEEGLFDEEFLQQIQHLSDTVKQVNRIRSVNSITNTSQLIVGPFGPIEVPYLHVDEPEKYASDSARIYQSDVLVGALVSDSLPALCITIQTDPFLSKRTSDSLVDVLDAIYATYEFDEMHVSGRINGQKYYVTKMQYELSIFVTTSLVLLVIFLWFSYRAWWGIWVPITVVMLAIIWLLAVMSLLGRSIDLMTVLLPTILFVVGMSDVVHILTRFLEELRNGQSKAVAVTIAFKHIGMATFLTSLTTSIGFLTLLTAKIVPVQEFGVNTAIGVFIAFILAFSLLPSLLILFKRPRVAAHQNERLFWNKRMHAWFGIVVGNYKKIVAVSVILIILSLWGISNIRVDNYLLEDLSEGDPHRADFEFFENNFAGVRPFDYAIWVKDSTKTLFDEDVAYEVDKLEQYLKQHYELGYVVSTNTIAKGINQAINGGSPGKFDLPEGPNEFKRLKRLINVLKKRPEFQAVISEDLTQGRISAKVRDYGGNRMKKLNTLAEEELAMRVDTNVIGFRQTGMAMLIDKNNESLASNMMYGLLIAFGIIAIIMGFLFKSIRIVVITLVPNVVPLLVIGGFMGLTGIDLKVSTSIIFTIAFGIAVDDTIHYMSKLKLELNKGRSLLYALKRSSISTGKAITVTSLILCSGFVTLILSDFTSTYYIGLLVSMTLLFAVLSDLFLLPALMIMFGKRK